MHWTLRNPLKKRPPDGAWKCLVDGYEFSGESPEEVAEKIRQYRLRHNLEPGGEYQLVVDYNCELYPHLGRKSDGPETQEEKTSSVPDDIWQSLRNILSADERPVMALDAVIREKICTECPFNSEERFPEEEQTNQYIKLAMNITNGRYIRNPELGLCLLHRHDNALAVWLSNTASTPKEEQPENCWVR